MFVLIVYNFLYHLVSLRVMHFQYLLTYTKLVDPFEISSSAGFIRQEIFIFDLANPFYWIMSKDHGFAKKKKVCSFASNFIINPIV